MGGISGLSAPNSKLQTRDDEVREMTSRGWRQDSQGARRCSIVRRHIDGPQRLKAPTSSGGPPKRTQTPRLLQARMTGGGA